MIAAQPKERALASIRTISTLQPIYTAGGEEANNILLAQVEGWKVIVRKGEFQEGDLCVFFEIDSILPETEWSEFLRARKFRIKTLKFNNMMVDNHPVISQGLALPVSIIPHHEIYVDLITGADLTLRLGVSKFEVPEAWSQAGLLAPFHAAVPKTDEKRIQSYLAALGQMHGLPFYITQKLDGSSCTVLADDLGLHVYSRNFEVEFSSNYGLAAEASGISQAAQDNPFMAIQGEAVGPGIQGNKLGLPQARIFVFNIYDMKAARYLNFSEMRAFCILNNLQTVPVQKLGDAFDYTLEQLETMANAGIYNASGSPQEGIVIRPQTEQYSSILEGRLSFKVISTEFLLKEK